MKFILSFFVILSLFSASCLSQDLNKSNEVKNILSIAAGSTSTTLGFTYERILSSRKVSLEIGTGLLLGGGLGMNYYLFKLIKKGQFNPFLGFRSSYNIQGSGGSRVVNYVPIGINFLGSKKFYLSIDVGPAYIIQLVPNGSYSVFQSNYPEHLFYVYGGFKVGFGF